MAQLQNRFFIEHHPVAAYVRCLKEKEWKKKIVCFYSTKSDILLCGIARFSRGNKNKLRTFKPQKGKKIRTASLKQNLLVLIKKECKFHCYKWQRKDIKNSWCFPIKWKILRFRLNIFLLQNIFFKKCGVLNIYKSKTTKCNESLNLTSIVFMLCY